MDLSSGKDNLFISIFPISRDFTEGIVSLGGSKVCSSLGTRPLDEISTFSQRVFLGEDFRQFSKILTSPITNTEV